jgi:CrcB protein
MVLKTVLLVACGGAIGSVARHGFNQIALKFAGSDFPWGTLGVNVIGSLLIGIVIGLLAFMTQWSQDIRAFAVVGILGGFTTFSAFSIDALLLGERGSYGLMFLYISASVILSLLAAFGGLLLVKAFSP